MEVFAEIKGRRWRLMGREQFCAWIGIRPGTLRRWMRQGTVRVCRLDTARLVMIGQAEDKKDYVVLKQRILKQR
jgi:predicted site-specific integrase-resolvase